MSSLLEIAKKNQKVYEIWIYLLHWISLFLFKDEVSRRSSVLKWMYTKWESLLHARKNFCAHFCDCTCAQKTYACAKNTLTLLFLFLACVFLCEPVCTFFCIVGFRAHFAKFFSLGMYIGFKMFKFLAWKFCSTSQKSKPCKLISLKEMRYNLYFSNFCTSIFWYDKWGSFH